MERVYELIQPYLSKPGVIGIYLIGSATRPHVDERSDLDIEVIVEDAAYDATPMEERQIFAFKDKESRIVDYEFYLIPWSDFVALKESTHDLFHYPYQHAIVLHDPDERIAPVIEQLAALPEDVRTERMTVHFLEFLYRLGRSRKTHDRGDTPINQALLRGDALSCLTKLIFLVHGSWPATAHWSEQELAALDVPLELTSGIKTWLSDPGSDNAAALVRAVRSALDVLGETFHHDMEGSQQWLFFTKEGKAAHERWGCR